MQRYSENNGKPYKNYVRLLTVFGPTCNSTSITITIENVYSRQGEYSFLIGAVGGGGGCGGNCGGGCHDNAADGAFCCSAATSTAASFNSPATYAIALSSSLSARGKPPYFPDETGRAAKSFQENNNAGSGIHCNFCKNNGEREVMFR